MNLTQRVAEVLHRHQYHRPNRGCLCGWEIDASDPMNPTHIEDHVAETVVAELREAARPKTVTDWVRSGW